MNNFKTKSAFVLCAIALGFNTAWTESKKMDNKTMQGKEGMQTKMNMMSADQMIENWPAKPKEAAAMMILKYGAPQEATDQRLIWSNNGPWKRTTITRQEFKHDFPVPHTDFMEQAINYKVPVDKYDDLAIFDGSVMEERTSGELSARCDKEENNLLALNLANDVITGKRTPEEARKEYGNEISKSMASKEKSAYMQKLQFTVKSGSMADPDVSTLPPMKISQAPNE